MGRVLGVDLGTRRVGLALTDPGRTIASPLETITFTSEARVAGRLAALCAERGADLVVIGLPVGEDGQEGEGCARARRVADRLRSLGVAAETWDERWTSREAEEALRRTGWRRERDPGRVDAVAAALVLRDWLDSRAGRR